MSPTDLEKLLRQFPQVATLVKDRGYRQIWRFEFENRGYYLKLYPRKSGRLKRLFRGSPAAAEFRRLQALQKAAVPAPRAVAQLVGFTVNGVKGDAVIVEAIEPSVPLDRYLTDFIHRGQPIPDHLELSNQLRQLVHQLARARLGHDDLHLGNILLQDGRLFLLDGYSVRFGGLTSAHVMQLAHSVQGLATRTDLQRGWELLGPGGPMPHYNPISQRNWRKSVQRAHRENDYFGKLRHGDWSGFFFKQYKFPRRWAPASSRSVTADDWNKAWPMLLEQVLSEQLVALKRGASGDVWQGEVVLGGKPLAVVVKRPYKRHPYRYLTTLLGSRAAREWRKSWQMIVRDIPTAWPLLLMENRKFGYVTDAMIVFERVPGSILAWADLDALPAAQRDALFRRTGTILRRIEQLGFSHFDAKASNWIVQQDPEFGPRPILIDVDGVRHRRWAALGVERLLRSMREHQQYTPADSLALCQGYAPFSKTLMESAADDKNATEPDAPSQ